MMFYSRRAQWDLRWDGDVGANEYAAAPRPDRFALLCALCAVLYAL